MKRPVILTLLVSLLISILYSSCSKNQGEEPQPQDENNQVTASNVSYENFVGSLIQNKCSACHASGGEGASQWTFSGYTSVKDNGTRIHNAVLVTGIMPKVGSLSSNEKVLLKAWFDRNMPEK